jgi:RimJ/RimL family protein N-acetyltransferase
MIPDARYGLMTFRSFKPSNRTSPTEASVVVQQLSVESRSALLRHFEQLAPHDRHLRFGTALPNERIAVYVESIDFERDSVFGVYAEALELTGVAHLACAAPGMAELGLSVLAEHRQRGLGTALLQRAVTRARNLQIAELYMHCLAENSAVMHMARKAGMRVVVDSPEADAYLKLRPGDAVSAGRELVEQQLALVDYAYKSHIDRLRRIKQALLAGSASG